MPQAVVPRDNERQRLKPQGGNTRPSRRAPQLHGETRGMKKKNIIIWKKNLFSWFTHTQMRGFSLRSHTLGRQHQLMVDWSYSVRWSRAQRTVPVIHLRGTFFWLFSHFAFSLPPLKAERDTVTPAQPLFSSLSKNEWTHHLPVASQ